MLGKDLHKARLDEFSTAGRKVRPQKPVAATPPPAPVVDIARIREEAYRRRHGGRQAGSCGTDRQLNAATLKRLSDAFGEMLQEFEQGLANDVLSMSLELTKLIVRQAIRVKPDLVLSVVREARFQSAPAWMSTPLCICIRPTRRCCARLLRADPALANLPWKIVDDARIERGGCRLETRDYRGRRDIGNALAARDRCARPRGLVDRHHPVTALFPRTLVSRIRRWQRYFEDCKAAARASQPFTVSGRLTRVAGLVMEAVGLKLPVGNGCYVLTPSGQRVDAEVVGFSGDRLFLMPSTDIYGLKPGALVVPVDPAITRVPRLGEDFVPRRRAEDRAKQVPVGPALLGTRGRRCRPRAR